MLALEVTPVDEKSIDSSGTSEPGELNTTLTPTGVMGSTGLCCQNILRPRQRLYDGIQTCGFKKGRSPSFYFSFFFFCIDLTDSSETPQSDKTKLGVMSSITQHSPASLYESSSKWQRPDLKIPSLTTLSICRVVEGCCWRLGPSQRLFRRASPGLGIKRWSKLVGLAIVQRLR
ncbi:hypothetical protein LY78DRAFT_26637 [Colletotrichum sublineola]|nr:hypothetical protein LY78DRAFT_26637 [Colletotrichum sublineola]